MFIFEICQISYLLLLFTKPEIDKQFLGQNIFLNIFGHKSKLIMRGELYNLILILETSILFIHPMIFIFILKMLSKDVSIWKSSQENSRKKDDAMFLTFYAIYCFWAQFFFLPYFKWRLFHNMLHKYWMNVFSVQLPGRFRRSHLGVVHKLREQDFGLFLHPTPPLWTGMNI